jgi:hypothetical protein
MKRAIALAVAASLGLALGGCGGIQARKERSDRIIDSVDRVTAARSALMTVSSEVTMKLARGELLAAGGGVVAPALPVRTFPVQADLGHDTAAYLAAGPGGTAAAVRIYAGTTVYAHRTSATTTRPWVRLDLRSLDPDDIDHSDVAVAEAVRSLQGVQTIENPLLLLKLLRGTLSGSVDEVGTESVGGVPTHHYKLNIDREKALEDEDEDVQDAYEAVFKSMFATRLVFPGEVWLDDEGLPRRYAVTLKPKVRRKDIADLRLTVELSDIGRPVDIALPGKAETARVEDLGALTQAITGAGE